MSVLPILKWPDPRLSAVCARVDAITPEVERLVADMFETMYAAPGRGLAGPQVGAMCRIFVMDVTWKDGTRTPVVCINPEIMEASEELATNDEGCLSIPGVSTAVTRPARVRMRWTGLDGVVTDRWCEGFEAACAQHELDHLDGLVTLDRISPADRTRVEADYSAALA